MRNSHSTFPLDRRSTGDRQIGRCQSVGRRICPCCRRKMLVLGGKCHALQSNYCFVLPICIASRRSSWLRTTRELQQTLCSFTHDTLAQTDAMEWVRMCKYALKFEVLWLINEYFFFNFIRCSAEGQNVAPIIGRVLLCTSNGLITWSLKRQIRCEKPNHVCTTTSYTQFTSSDLVIEWTS